MEFLTIDACRATGCFLVLGRCGLLSEESESVMKYRKLYPNEGELSKGTRGCSGSSLVSGG